MCIYISRLIGLKLHLHINAGRQRADKGAKKRHAHRQRLDEICQTDAKSERDSKSEVETKTRTREEKKRARTKTRQCKITRQDDMGQEERVQ